MPSPNPSIGDLVATTIESRTGKLADNVSIHNAVLMRMKQRGNVVPISGGTKILEELEYDENSTTKWYSGYETLDVSPQELFSAAEYPIKQLAGTVATSGYEELVNAGKEQKIAYVQKKVKNLEKSLMNTMVRSLFSDGTGDGGKQLTGLKAQISTTPSTGTLGGISRASYDFWRNVAFDGASDGGAAVSSSNIQDYMTRVALQLVRNSDFPDMVIMDANFYRHYTNSLTPLQRVTGNDTFGSGFKSLKFFAVGNEVDVIFAGNGVGMDADKAYFVNTNYLRLRPHSARNMTRIGDRRQPINQDAMIEIVGWAGNMTTSNTSLQGVLT